MSTITPPVCGAVFIAAGMVQENWLKVAFKAMALGVGLYLIPLSMIANPSLIMLASHPVEAIIAALQTALGISLVSFALIAPALWWRRALMLVAGLIILLFRAF